MKRAALPFGSGPWPAEGETETTERAAIWRWIQETEDPAWTPGRELHLLEAVPDDIVERRKAELRALMAGDAVVEADPLQGWNWTVLMIQRVIEAVTVTYGEPKALDPHAGGEHTHYVEWALPEGGKYWRAWVRHPQRQELWREDLGDGAADPLEAATSAAATPEVRGQLLPTVEEYASRRPGKAPAAGTCTVCGQPVKLDELSFLVAENVAHYHCVIKDRRARRTGPSPTAAKLKAARKRVLGLTQKKVAAFLGVKESHVSQAELGAAAWTPEQVAKLAAAFCLPVATFTDDAQQLPEGPLTWTEVADQPTQDLLGVDFDDAREPGDDRDEEH